MSISMSYSMEITYFAYIYLQVFENKFKVQHMSYLSLHFIESSLMDFKNTRI